MQSAADSGVKRPASPSSLPFSVRPLAPQIGAEIGGLDLSRPLAEATFEALEAAWHAHCVLLFRGQTLTEGEQVAFAERFGPLSKLALMKFKDRHPAVMFVSNIRENGELIGALPDGEMFFHSDQCYMERPAKATLLYAIEIPAQGGNTLFANMYRAYETLPDALKRKIAGRRAMNIAEYNIGTINSSAIERLDNPDPNTRRHAHPMVRTHPATGRKALYVNRLLSAYVEGMPRGESDALLRSLFDHQEQPGFAYEHAWKPGDLVIWDNRCTVHARTDFDASERRLLRRVIVLGETPV